MVMIKEILISHEKRNGMKMNSHRDLVIKTRNRSTKLSQSIKIKNIPIALACVSILFFSLSMNSSHALFVNKKAMTRSHKKMTIDKTQPIILQADNVDYDEKAEIVTATGNVYISQGPNLLRADRVQYLQKEDKVIASGSVWLKDEEGNYAFSDTIELQNEMNDGFVENIKVIMTDDSRAASSKAKRYKGEKVIMWQGLYSPCPLCKKNPTPLWQIKGDKIIHDKTDQTLTYNHAWMEVLGVPVIYTPYFYHPDPTVKRKTGLLIPQNLTSKDFGYAAMLPFYINTGKNHDLTIFPTFTTEQGVILAAEHRYRFVDGEYTLTGSLAPNTTTTHRINGKEKKEKLPTRWNVFLNGRYDISDETVFNIEVMRASDLPYVKRFPVVVGSKTNITAVEGALRTTASIENFQDTSYGIVQGYLFQSQTPKFTPVILPIAKYMYETMPGIFNETLYLDANFLNLFREQGIPGLVAQSMVRGSLGVGGQLPYVTPMGDIWQLNVDVRGDGYAINHFKKHIQSDKKSYTKTRLYPQASLTWRYPFINYFDCSQWIVEPASMIITSSHGGNGISIPNEDSPIVVVEQTNLFLNDRYYGLDRIDNGTRAVYGIHNRHYFSEGRKVFLFFGQSIRLDDHRVLPLNSGEDKHASNFIVGVTLAPFTWFSAQSRLMLNRKRFSVEIAESSATVTTPWLDGSFNHVYYNPRVLLRSMDPRSKHRAISQANWSVKTHPYKKFVFSYIESEDWSRRVKHGKHRPPSLQSRAITAQYHHECVIATLSIIRTTFRDKDFRPDTKVMLQFNLKNIGNVAPIQLLGSGGMHNPSTGQNSQ